MGARSLKILIGASAVAVICFLLVRPHFTRTAPAKEVVEPSNNERWRQFEASLANQGYENLKKLRSVPVDLLGPLNALAIDSEGRGDLHMLDEPTYVGSVSQDAITFGDKGKNAGVLKIDAVFSAKKGNVNSTILVAGGTLCIFANALDEPKLAGTGARFGLQIVGGDMNIKAVLK